MIDELDRDEGVALTAKKEEKRKTEEAKNSDGDDQVKGRQVEIYQIDMDHPSKVLSMQEDEPTKVEEVLEVVTTAKLITEVVAAAGKSVSAASTTIPAAEPQVPAATPTAVLVRVAAASTRRRKGVVIKDPEEASITIKPTDTKSKDKGKGKMVEDPKPMKEKQYVELDEEYARKLHEELNKDIDWDNKDIDWDTAIEHMKQKAKEDLTVQRHQVMKKRPQTEGQARKNMMMYLKNEEETRAIESINETPTQKIAKRRRLNEEVAELNKHLEIVPDEDDDVFTEATPLARKVPIVDYSFIFLNNKPHYKIVKADGTYSAMFEEADDQDQIWKNQRTVHGQVRVKSWKLLELCGVHIVILSTVQLILLVERKYPLSRYTLDQMLNALKLRVEEQSEISLELLRSCKAGSDDEIFTSVAWMRAFNINELIYAEICHEFYLTCEFDKVCADDELQTKKIIKFRLGGCAHSLTLLEFSRRLGLYQAVKLEDEGFNVYFEGVFHYGEPTTHLVMLSRSMTSLSAVPTSATTVSTTVSAAAA
nr:hypothetical protein [Tanacetum cinerariifolium]